MAFFQPMASWMFNTHRSSWDAIDAVAKSVDARVWHSDEAREEMGRRLPPTSIAIHLHPGEWTSHKTAFDKALAEMATRVGEGHLSHYTLNEPEPETEPERRQRERRERGW